MCAARRKRPERWNSNEKKVNSYHDPLDGADRILVMHKGRLRETGTHNELLALKGIYWNLYRLQFKDQEIARAS